MSSSCFVFNPYTFHLSTIISDLQLHYVFLHLVNLSRKFMVLTVWTVREFEDRPLLVWDSIALEITGIFGNNLEDFFYVDRIADPTSQPSFYITTIRAWNLQRQLGFSIHPSTAAGRIVYFNFIISSNLSFSSIFLLQHNLNISQYFQRIIYLRLLLVLDCWLIVNTESYFCSVTQIACLQLVILIFLNFSLLFLFLLRKEKATISITISIYFTTISILFFLPPVDLFKFLSN